MFVLIEIVINEPTFPLSHTLRATCGTLHFQWARNYHPRNGNYSGGFLIANCAGKKCTARCSRVAQRFSDVCTLWCSYQWANISAEPHVASNVRYIAFSMRTNTLLTPSKARYISYLGHTPNTAEPHAFKQGVVHCLATTSDVPRNVKSKLFSRENF